MPGNRCSRPVVVLLVYCLRQVVVSFAAGERRIFALGTILAPAEADPQLVLQLQPALLVLHQRKLTLKISHKIQEPMLLILYMIQIPESFHSVWTLNTCRAIVLLCSLPVVTARGFTCHCIINRRRWNFLFHLDLRGSVIA